MSDPDYIFALHLQKQFEIEATTSAPKSITKKKNRNNENTERTVITLNRSRSLIDPEWEMIDPTPNIHTLFIAFSERFFWNKLQTVCVSWSKRMTSCAGICSYQGRGGMCSITLSEPLLKLRPRKDLIETLLHEMIHAYLFVTHNNKDRDGHGPEFHKHMWRINKETGTNITVYHSFHDEVAVYQQHWWRCDGPCQHRKPFFGMVRRAMNRAPGPNDRWWAEHLASCGGKFIKVKEPEKSKKLKESSKTMKVINTSPKADIRNYFPSTTNNIYTLKNITTQNNGNQSNNNSVEILSAKGSSNGFVLSDSKHEKANDYSTVRNHWLQKFGNVNSKRNSDSTPEAPKKQKSEISPKQTSSPTIENNNIECPVCTKKISASLIDEHIDNCLSVNENKNISEQKTCEICKNPITTNYDIHMEKCLLKMMDEMVETRNAPIKRKKCLTCNKEIAETSLDSHTMTCFVEMSDDEDEESFLHTFQSSFETEETEKKYNCPFCMKMVLESKMNSHLDNCLNEDKPDNSEKSVLYDFLL